MTAFDAVVNDAVVAERLHAVHERIARAGGSDVAVLPVTKSFGIEACWAAYRAGCPRSARTTRRKSSPSSATSDCPPFEIHFIGQLQTNKVRMLAPIVSLFGSVDRPSQVRELAKRAPGARVLVQVQAPGTRGQGRMPDRGRARADRVGDRGWSHGRRTDGGRTDRGWPRGRSATVSCRCARWLLNSGSRPARWV